MNKKKKCYECNKKELIEITEDVTFEGENIESYTIPQLSHEKCLYCENRFFGPEAQKKIDQYRKNLQEKQFNGRIALRIPKSLHKNLYTQSKKEGISLNQLCLYLLSSKVEEKQFQHNRMKD
jgi:predicted HicB family RNase H-like nuclease